MPVTFIDNEPTTLPCQRVSSYFVSTSRDVKQTTYLFFTLRTAHFVLRSQLTGGKAMTKSFDK